MAKATQGAAITVPPASRQASRASREARGRPFFGAIDSVLVPDDLEFDFEGSISREDADAVWTWVVRDLAADLIDPGADGADPAVAEAFEALMPELLRRVSAEVAATGTSHEIERRVRTQLGSESAWENLPRIQLALKCRAALEKAQGFGRAANGIHDEAALATALQSMPLRERAITALLMQAAVGFVANPSKLVNAAIRLVGSDGEVEIGRAGFSPLVDALLSQAQTRIPLVTRSGVFADIDLVCRAVDRFHRLIKAVNLIDIGRHSRWARVIGGLTKTISERLDPNLREVGPDLNKALRRSREATDRVDRDQILSAYNGVYLLSTVRDCRESLALNAISEQVWSEVGQTLEMHVDRNLEVLRRDPSDRIASERLEAGIKMSELRFGSEYAEILRRARDAAERRPVT